jgi:ATP-binding cassette subfamily B protein
VFARLGRMLATQLCLYALGALAWTILGRGALLGTLDRGWLLGWALAVLSMIPLQVLASWHGGFLALDAGAVFKQRLLAGAMRLDPDVARREGAGALLGRVIESSAVEAGALSGASASIAVLPELALALVALAAGAGGALHALAFAATLGLAAALAARHVAARRRWTRCRLGLTHDLIERMVGHRTRLAQEPPSRRHEGEDEALARYLAASAALDRTQAHLAVSLPRAWTLVGIAALVPAMLDRAAAPTSLALGVGAVLLAGHALRSVTAGVAGLAAAAVAWREVGPIFRAAALREPTAAPVVAPRRRPASGGAARAAVEAGELTFRREGRADPVLRGVSLRVAAGDRVLLEGPSGGGKSTLGALLAGLRAPTSGLLLLDGLDGASVGAAAWRRRVVTAPQFHENHVMAGTLAFNLLMGRRWPPTPDDLVEAEAVSRELALGGLLDRMPAGLQQVVGESGWRLSHGEQGRLFLARALVQGAELAVLDESFAALDPATLRVALACALRRCPSLVVIAHP